MLYKIYLAFFIFLAGMLLSAGYSWASDEPWELEADQMYVDQEKNLVEAFGNVLMWRMDDYVQADYARLYTDTNWIYLKGNIQARFEGDHIEGREAELDLDNHVGWIKDGKVFMAQDNVYFSGERMEKTGPHTYTFEEGVMTSCDDRPAPWSIKSSRGEVTVEGYARLWHPRFRVKDRPVLYSPYMIAPVKTKRQSGFLFPTFGQGSEYGFNFNLPYYHVIDDQRDMTFYANYYTDRGFMPGVEYRHTP
ncbi:putative LPS assembly protein LptD, partial [Desulfonatronospira sp. MSAO_Bac3]|uniref:LPS-assembly protein LptD n=1 Tax=Desulfonatronospira sp. MSAO_Bac3 TaxID=2293857 RepID=UPI000FF49553